MSSLFPPAGAAMALPPFGNGHSRETAQWSFNLTENPGQPAYIVNTTLDPLVKWQTCTKTEAIYYQETGYQIWRVVDSRKVIFRRKKQDPNAAFSDHFEEVAIAEQDLEAAGVEATRDEGLMNGADNDDNDDEVFDVGFEKSSSRDDAGSQGASKTPCRSGAGIVGGSSASKKE
ncbi:hypothetical protein BU25DRAFT_453516 [Macroventuria anomochaeta]|uniref:Uncharacterized protein n=1 Tax=Macroventuria anomochaeta TaxID=301207 RepID=A0ACB6SJ93_9PLEO|nr:uncharacterized protein BU25DRAFT_453516 [Macroventuria anomochaeta]KAF2633790.1 hypothetical protein BU25DRAFT_453516 [Macroventuria anomochaeta]